MAQAEFFDKGLTNTQMNLRILSNTLKDVSQMTRKQFDKPVLAQLAADIYDGKIDGWDTKMVATHYGISQNLALKSLKSIVAGDIFAKAYPFGEYCQLMCGVTIKDGTTFTYGDNADYSEGKRGTNHYNWFTN